MILVRFACVGTLVGLLAVTGAATEPITFWDDRVTVGGEFRLRTELRDDYYKKDGTSKLDDEFTLFRSRLHLEVMPEEWIRFYLEAQDSRQFGSEQIDRYSVPNSDESDLDLYKGYVELIHPGELPFSFRVGRQELDYGDKRLLSEPGWSNVGRTFDALKIMLDVYDYGTIDLFAGEPVIHDWGNFNESNDDEQLFGAYSKWTAIEELNILEVYYLLKNNDLLDDEVHTLGTRLGNKYESGWDWEIEAAGQWGDFHGLDHGAWAIHTELGYTFHHKWKPRLEAGYSAASGDDDPNDGDNGTFDNLYPTNHMHYGYLDFFSWRNMHNAETNLSFYPVKPIKIYIGAHAFWLMENEDNWYKSNGKVIRYADPAAGSYVGSQIDVKAVWKISKNVEVEGGYSHFFPGDFVDDTGDDEQASKGYFMATLKF